MRSAALRLALAVGLLVAPLLAYEALEKAAEVGGLAGSWSSLSRRCDRDVPWRARSGAPVLDRTLHEVQEAGLFYRLAWRRVQRRLG